MLMTDVHRAQKTDQVKRPLQSKKTIVVNLPPEFGRQLDENIDD